MDEEKEYQDYLAYLDHVGGAEPAQKPPGIMDRLKTAAGYALKPLDYAGGIARTGIAGTVQTGVNAAGKLKSMATGGEYEPVEAVTGDDMVRALKGEAPSSAEMLAKAGMPEGGALSDVAPILFSKDPSSLRPTPHGKFDPTVRGAVGMGLDVASDPLTYLGAGPLKALVPGGRAGQVAEHILNPAETLLQGGGKKLYKSAPIMKAADAVNERYGKQAASDILFDSGVRGTGRQVATKADALAGKVGAERNALLSQADEAGAVLNMDAAMSPAEEFIGKIRKSRDPQLLPIADALQEQAAKYRGLNASEAVRGVTASEGSGFKSTLYNDTGNATWDTLRRTPQGDLGNKSLARGLDLETSAAAERALPGAGAKIDDLNDTWGALLTPRKALENEALKGEKKNLVTSVDGALFGLTHGNPAVLAAKKTTDALKTNWFKTNVGMGMHKLGGVPLLDEILRREAINSSQQPPTDWQKLNK